MLPASWAHPQVREAVNAALSQQWDAVRWLLSIHYRFNTRLDTPFWKESRSTADISGFAPLLEVYALLHVIHKLPAPRVAPLVGRRLEQCMEWLSDAGSQTSHTAPSVMTFPWWRTRTADPFEFIDDRGRGGQLPHLLLKSSGGCAFVGAPQQPEHFGPKLLWRGFIPAEDRASTGRPYPSRVTCVVGELWDQQLWQSG
jgi:hypothetical protein